jgi:ribose transport system substrate-binding protein
MGKAIAVTALAAMLMVSGPVNAGAAEVGVILTGYVLGFWRAMTKGMTSAAQDLDVDLLIRSPADGSALDEQKNIQLKLIDFMVGQGVAGIVLAPEPLEGVTAPISPAVPLVLVDRGSTDYQARSTVATDNFAAGRAAALSLAPVLHKGAKVAVLRLAANIPSTTARENGFVSVAKEKGWTVAVDTFVGYKLREAEEATAKALKGYGGRLDAVFVPNESAAYGAVRVVSAMPAQSRPRLVAFDWRPEFSDALRNGSLYATVLQDPYGMGYRAVAAAVAASRGQKLPPHEFTEVTVATKANIDQPLVRRLTEHYED